MSSKTCTEVTPYCPVSATVLGYYPNLGVNAFLAAGYGLCLVGLIVTGVWKRTWGYSAALTAGCILEFAGYIARVQLHANPWNQDAFETQICAIILGPTLICISIYLTLKHATRSLHPGLSRLAPRAYPLVFVPADVSCLVLQAIGGALAASASYDAPALLRAGDRVIIAGIALQAVVLLAFGAVSADYYLRVRRWLRSSAAPEDDTAVFARRTWDDRRFRRFAYAVAGAYAGILVRCIYRIAEMAGGWGNYIMQDEPSFIVLEGFCVLIPVALLTAFPPGFLFPAMTEREAQRFRRKKNQPRQQQQSSNSNSSGSSPEPVVTTGEKGGDVTPEAAPAGDEEMRIGGR
ncbi:RTA1-domain-containing protein [Xylariomycetidae sp. FL0641]|nr:RTA1-domain-containing protein [Xylariomycetidae sp. FL0641]